MADRSRRVLLYEETLSVFEATAEPLTSVEVADALDLDRRAVYERLANLADDGRLETKKVGASGRVWWLPDRDDDPPTATDGSSTADDPSITDDPSIPDGPFCNPICVVDDDGHVAYANDRFYDRFAYESDDVLGEHFTTFVDEDTVRRVGERLSSAVEAGVFEVSRITTEVQTGTGASVTVESDLVVLRGPDGTYDGAFCHLRDVTDRDVIDLDVIDQNTLDRNATCRDVVNRDTADRDATRNELARPQESPSVMNNLQTVVVEITEAVLDRQTRNDIETAVCERLAGSDSYASACILEVKPDRNELVPRVRAGVGSQEPSPVPIDDDSPRGRNPASQAARTGTLQASRNFYTETQVDEWQKAGEKYGLRSCAAVPIVHESTLYGLLCLTSERGDAFGIDERAVLDQLGTIVGHAIATVDRNRAMMSDEIIEVGLYSRKRFESEELDSLTDGVVEMHRTIPIDEGRYLMYGTACENGFEGLEQEVESDAFSYFESLSVISNDGDRTTFEAVVSDAPVTSVVTEHGGYVNESRYENGDFFASIHLPPEADVGKLVEEIQSIEPSLEPINRRQKVREQRSFEDVSSVIDETLTDRQRDTLEAAYISGFFEWPRDSSGEAVASSLGVSPATFHQHVRTAEKKILKVLLNDD